MNSFELLSVCVSSFFLFLIVNYYSYTDIKNLKEIRLTVRRLELVVTSVIGVVFTGVVSQLYRNPVIQYGGRSEIFTEASTAYANMQIFFILGVFVFLVSSLISLKVRLLNGKQDESFPKKFFFKRMALDTSFILFVVLSISAGDFSQAYTLDVAKNINNTNCNDGLVIKNEKTIFMESGKPRYTLNVACINDGELFSYKKEVYSNKHLGLLNVISSAYLDSTTGKTVIIVPNEDKFTGLDFNKANEYVANLINEIQNDIANLNEWTNNKTTA